MPPANSPTENTTPRNSQATPIAVPSSYIPDFRLLTAPIPELASTLSYPGHADVNMDADNLSFLRSSLEPVGVMSSEDLTRELRNQRRRRDVAQRLNNVATDSYHRQIHERRPSHTGQRLSTVERAVEPAIDRSRAAYGNGAPDHQSLFDWAPAEANDVQDDTQEDVQEMESEFTELLRQQPNTHPEILRVLARARTDSNREARHESTTRTQGQVSSAHEPSLRSAAILQSFRRNHRILARSRDSMSRVATVERDTGDEQHDLNAHRSHGRQSQPTRVWNDPNRYAGMDLGSGRVRGAQTTRAEDLEALRRRYLQTPSSKVNEFERIIKQLHALRSLDNESKLYSQSHGTAQSPEQTLSLTRGERMHTHDGCQLAPTSWLVPGSTFVGTQQANPTALSSAATMYRLVNNQSRQSQPHHSPSARNTTSSASMPHWLRHLTLPELQSLYSSPEATVHLPPSQDCWTVNVSIYNVDYTSMTLQGTMEAFNVPSAVITPVLDQVSTEQHSTTPTRGSPSDSPFCTYVEGEIIDMKTHTLLTESDSFGVKTTPDVDALYWRRLEPFSNLSDDGLTSALLDPKWINEELMDKYVLMRWKERCFIKPPSTTARSERTPAPMPQSRTSTTSFLSGPDGHGYGLSISGFYYVSLRRSDGKLEGLYFDPQSSPYQHLEMMPRAGGWGSASWSFR